MVLQPRKFIFKGRQKQRKKKRFKREGLSYGLTGLQLHNPLKITSKQVFRLSIFLKRSVRKQEKTQRFLWLNLFPHLPLTKKVKGSRMGKGTGKLTLWFTFLPAGIFFVEFKNLRPGRLHYFSKQIEARVQPSCSLVRVSTKNIQFTNKISSTTRLNPFNSLT